MFVDISGVIIMIQITNQNKYKETLTKDKKKFLMKENGKQFKAKVVSVSNVVKIDQQCYVFITETHLKKN